MFLNIIKFAEVTYQLVIFQKIISINLKLTVSHSLINMAYVSDVSIENLVDEPV